MPFLATGAGHGYSTSLGRLHGGIDLDLGAFDTVEVDSAAKTMTIGGSVRTDLVAKALQAAGMEIRRYHRASLVELAKLDPQNLSSQPHILCLLTFFRR